MRDEHRPGDPLGGGWCGCEAGEEPGVVGAGGEVDQLVDLVVGGGTEQGVDGEPGVGVARERLVGELTGAVGGLPVGEHQAGAG